MHKGKIVTLLFLHLYITGGSAAAPKPTKPTAGESTNFILIQMSCLFITLLVI